MAAVAASQGQIRAMGLGAPVLIVALLAMVVLPLPAAILDLLFTVNISLSLIILLVVVYAVRPLEFSVFPTVLLVATLLRLSLNVASTRVVLLHGHNGPDAAGNVIEAFGQFVVGGDYAVGFVIFAILILINFVVVTKGAGRISEVSARFTLDALPGKQMAIDADLNAGVITQEEAKTRRLEVGQEADFYGAMDGASKFVRGDAIAGLLILVINILGGLAVGTMKHDLSAGEAMRTYTLLTIGDGLVAQVPGLVLSTAAAMLVTRVSTTHDVGQQIVTQLFANPKALFVTASILGALGLIPGMPNLVFLVLAGSLAAFGMYFLRIDRREKPVEADNESTDAVAQMPELNWNDVVPVDSVGLEVGYRLIPLIDRSQGGELMERIVGVRRKLTQDMGFLIPSVHIRDNLEISPTGYRVSLFGVEYGNAEIYPDKLMAISSGTNYGDLNGIAAKDPAFGLDAYWIDAADKEQAQSYGFTVVEPSAVVATHVSSVLQKHVHELFGLEDTQRLMDKLAETSPKLVEELVPKQLSLSVVMRVLQNLLIEAVSIRDIRSIAETLTEHAAKTKDPNALTRHVRARLGGSIVQGIYGGAKDLAVVTLHPELEKILQQVIKMADEGGGAPGIEPGLAEKLHTSLSEAAQHQLAEGNPPVLLVAPGLRHMLAQFVRHSLPELRVLALNEMPDHKRVRIVATVGA